MNQSRNNFVDIAIEYYEAGFQTIPIHAASVNGKGKAPLLEGWTTFGYEKKTIEQIEEFFTRRKDVIGIGLPFGDINPVCAIDVDDCTAEIRRKLPPSEVRRQGRPGREMRFYLKSPGLVSRKYKNVGVELFASSGQVLLPPSRHIEASCDYIWLTKDTLLSGLDCLTVLEPSMISFLDAEDLSVPVSTTYNGGRNNRLVGIASAIIARGNNDLSYIAQELYIEDLKHDKPLFSDATEGFKSNSKEESIAHAFKFALNIMSTQFKRGLIEVNPLPQLQIINDASLNIEGNNSVDSNNNGIDGKSGKSESIVYPHLANSIIDTFIELQRLKTGTSDTAALAIGGAVSLISYLAGNRFRAISSAGHDIRPNLYALNIAPSGSGKSIPQNIILSALKGDDCCTSEQYKSAQSFLENIGQQQTRLRREQN